MIGCSASRRDPSPAFDAAWFTIFTIEDRVMSDQGLEADPIDTEPSPEPPEVRLAVMRVSRELLCQIFHLPEGAEILSIWEKPEQYASDIYIKVSHPDLPKVFPGQVVIECAPRYCREEVFSEFNGPQDVVHFVSWGIGDKVYFEPSYTPWDRTQGGFQIPGASPDQLHAAFKGSSDDRHVEVEAGEIKVAGGKHVNFTSQSTVIKGRELDTGTKCDPFVRFPERVRANGPVEVSGTITEVEIPVGRRDANGDILDPDGIDVGNFKVVPVKFERGVMTAKLELTPELQKQFAEAQPQGWCGTCSAGSRRPLSLEGDDDVHPDVTV
jgi:hypothetical protein